MSGHSSSQTGSADYTSPNQRNFSNSLFGGDNALGGKANSAYDALISGLDPETMRNTFQKSVADPSLRDFMQNFLPAIQQQFGDANASSSSALNNAFSDSSANLESDLARQFIQYQQGEKQLAQGALGQLGDQSTARTQEPIITEKPSTAGSIFGAVAPAIAGALTGGAGGAGASILNSLFGKR